MVDYKVSPADQEILKTITAKSTWNDLTVSFRNKILPAGNLNKAIGERCAKLLKTLIKKDKVSSSTLSKGCPLLTKKIIKNQSTSIAKMEIKKDRDMKKKEQGDSKSNANNRKEDYYSALLNNIVKKQNEAQKQIITGQVETVNKVLVDTKQLNEKEQQEKEHNDYLDMRFKQYKDKGGNKKFFDYMEDIMNEEQEEHRANLPAGELADQEAAEQAYADAMRQANDDYGGFVIPQQPVVIPPYSVENDPMFQDPRNM